MSGVRFGLLIEGDSLISVYLQAAQHLCAIDGVKCAAVIVCDPATRRILPVLDCLQLIALPRDFANLPRCPIGQPDGIRALALDFILDCTMRTQFSLPGDVARYGVWSWSYGEGSDGGPLCFWELYRGADHMTVTLEQFSTPRKVLYRGVLNTDLTSLAKTVEAAVRATVDFPALVVRRLLASGRLPAVMPQPSAEARRPATLQLWLGAARIRLAWAKLQLSSVFLSEMWNVGVVQSPIAAFLESGFAPRVDWLPRFKTTKFIADPFAIALENGLELFVEEFDYERYQGYITAIEYRPGERVSPQGRVIIDEGIHTSYPQPILHNGDLYCIPECQRRREVVLYRRDPQTLRWQRVQTLLKDFAALDSTIVEHEGRWWLFCTCQDDYPECKLYIWYANELFGPWNAHRLNPVQCDVRGSRPGGTFFRHQGAFYRPAQDSSKSYGGALTIKRLLRLTPDEFDEEPVIHWPPLRGYWRDGFHTLSSAGEFSVIDGKRMMFTPSLAARRLRHKARRIVQACFRR
jgi:hypothetical protein